MRRREQNSENIYLNLCFRTEFNSEEEMTEQLSLYFEGLENFQSKTRNISRKNMHMWKEHLEEIDAQMNSASRGWKTKRMNSGSRSTSTGSL